MVLAPPSPVDLIAEAAPRPTGPGRGHVAEIQRARILAAMVEEIAERGVAKVTVAHVVARSGVSRRTFYELFEDREACFLAALDDGIARVEREVLNAYRSGGGDRPAVGTRRAGAWRERIRAGLVAGLSVLDGDLRLARLLIVESLGAGPRGLERRTHVLSGLIAAVDEGRTLKGIKGTGNPKGGNVTNAGAELPAVTAEGVVGAVLAVLHARLLEDSPPSLLGLTNALMGVIVLPYLGPAAARKELERALPDAAPRTATVERYPLRELGMRLTYRTVLVLLAVAASPGSSNRTIGAGAGIADQGQISKLLARLHGLGLIANTGPGRAQGEPNAWTLTTKGWEVQSVLAHTPAQV